MKRFAAVCLVLLNACSGNAPEGDPMMPQPTADAGTSAITYTLALTPTGSPDCGPLPTQQLTVTGDQAVLVDGACNKLTLDGAHLVGLNCAFSDPDLSIAEDIDVFLGSGSGTASLTVVRHRDAGPHNMPPADTSLCGGEYQITITVY